MTADVPDGTAVPRAAARAGDSSPFALSLLLRGAHWRAATVMADALRPSGIEFRHFSVLLVLTERGATVQRDLAPGTDKGPADAGDPWDEPEYEMYPPGLESPYRERRSDFGKARYGPLGISRDDWEARQKAAR